VETSLDLSLGSVGRTDSVWWTCAKKNNDGGDCVGVWNVRGSSIQPTPPPRSILGLLAPAEQTEERDNQKIRKQKMKKESYKKTQRWGRGRAGPWLKTFEGVDAEFGDVVARGRGPTLPSQSGKRRGREIENRSEG